MHFSQVIDPDLNGIIVFEEFWQMVGPAVRAEIKRVKKTIEFQQMTTAIDETVDFLREGSRSRGDDSGGKQGGGSGVGSGSAGEEGKEEKKEATEEEEEEEEHSCSEESSEDEHEEVMHEDEADMVDEMTSEPARGSKLDLESAVLQSPLGTSL